MIKRDIIGDVHGHIDKLVILLHQLGYRRINGVMRHPDRTAIFLGDLIDRGPGQLATVDLVKGMVEAGAAQCILGNHEFNAISWLTPNPEVPGKFLRDHDKLGNQQQHQAFLDEVKGTRHHQEIIAWFRTLPLWLDFRGCRIVHACWHEPSLRVLRPLLGPGNTLTEAVIVQGNTRGHPVFKAIEAVCKGIEVRLPEGVSFADKDGKVRHEVRVRWWRPDARTYRGAAIVPRGDKRLIPDMDLPPEAMPAVYSGPPVFFGHYWFDGIPEVISGQFACLDYSVAGGGPLVAYRWDGEAQLSSGKLVWT